MNKKNLCKTVEEANYNPGLRYKIRKATKDCNALWLEYKEGNFFVYNGKEVMMVINDNHYFENVATLLLCYIKNIF